MDCKLTYFLINAGLFLLNLLLQPLQSSSIWRSAIRLQHLDIPSYAVSVSIAKGTGRHPFLCTYSSVSGVIFFSGSSSSANSFLYFSQFCPVALGILRDEVLGLFVAYQVADDCGVQSYQVGRSRLESRDILKDAGRSVWRSGSIRCCRFVDIVRD